MSKKIKASSVRKKIKQKEKAKLNAELTKKAKEIAKQYDLTVAEAMVYLKSEKRKKEIEAIRKSTKNQIVEGSKKMGKLIITAAEYDRQKREAYNEAMRKKEKAQNTEMKKVAKSASKPRKK